MAKEIQIERHKKVPTSELNDIMLKEIQASPPQASHTGKEVKIKFVNEQV